MICPRCAAAEISPVTGKCDLCGFALAGVTVAAADGVVELAARQLAHEFSFADLVGRGRESAVFKAKEIGSGRDVVVKAMLRRNEEPDEAESFRTTMLALQQVDHPNIVPILRFGSTDSLFWHATDDRGAISLRARLAASGSMDARTCRRIVTQLAGALDHLHRRGLVHGAVKAENVLVDPNGLVGLTDPNVFRPRWRRPPRTTPLMPGVTPPQGSARQSPMAGIPVVPASAETGPQPWIAPEETARGERTSAADQYALGALTYELLAGHPYVVGTPSLVAQRTDVPVRMVRAIERALSAPSAQRFATCGDFLFALEDDAVVGMTHAPTRVTSEIVTVRDWQAPPDPRARLRRVFKVSAIALLAVSFIAVLPALKDAIIPAPAVPVEDGTVGDAPAPPSNLPSRAQDPAAQPTPTTAWPTRVAGRPDTPARPEPAPTRPPAAARAPTREPAAPVADPGTTTTVAGGRLFVNANPWGQVFIDGMSVGNTPRANLAVAPGSHVIRVVRDGFAPWERTVRVAAGDTLRFVDIVLAPITP